VAAPFPFPLSDGRVRVHRPTFLFLFFLARCFFFSRQPNSPPLSSASTRPQGAIPFSLFPYDCACISLFLFSLSESSSPISSLSDLYFFFLRATGGRRRRLDRFPPFSGARSKAAHVDAVFPSSVGPPLPLDHCRRGVVASPFSPFHRNSTGYASI